MKTKIIVAMIACLALGACSKQESPKGSGEQTQSEGKSEPSRPNTPPPAGSPQSMNESGTNLAAEDQAAANNAQDADNKAFDAKQDSNAQNNAAQNQAQNTALDQNADQHNQPED